MKTEIQDEDETVLVYYHRSAMYVAHTLRELLKEVGVHVHTTTVVPSYTKLSMYTTVITIDISLPNRIPVSPLYYRIYTHLSKDGDLDNHTHRIFITDTHFREQAPVIVEHIVRKRRSDLLLDELPPVVNYTSQRNPLFNTIVLYAIIIIVCAHLLFVPFLIFSGIATKLSLQHLDKPLYHVLSQQALSVADFLYKPVRPTYLIFLAGSGLEIDNSIRFLSTAQETISEVNELEQLVGPLLSADMQTSDTTASLRVTNTVKALTKLTQNISTLQQIGNTLTFLPIKYKEQLVVLANLSKKVEPILPFTNNILGFEKPQTYLFLFANNMELRPGGGFIGSFGLVTIDKGRLASLHIYDVYDADGQLNVKVQPPPPISEYLHQPFYFLRDSAFSESFPDNAKTAQDFLKKELNISSIDGTVLITTSAIQYILTAFPSLYIPSFGETISSSDFYTKAQLHVETNFFPGSTKKKNFLQGVSDALIRELPHVNKQKLVSMIEQSIDEKQLAFSSNNPSLQSVLDKNFLSARLVQPSCISTSVQCALGSTFLVEANMGVNKANAFVQRIVAETITLQKSPTATDVYTAHHTLNINYSNASKKGLPLGGSYKNYLQLIAGNNVSNVSVLLDNIQVPSQTSSEPGATRISSLIEIPEGMQRVVTISYDEQYTLPHQEDRIILQHAVLKQIGIQPYNYTLSLQLPPEVSLVDKNFPALVKDGTIIYNTKLSTDSLLVLELQKT